MEKPDAFYILTRLRQAGLEQRWVVENHRSYEGNLKISICPTISQTIRGYLVLNGLEEILEEAFQSNIINHNSILVDTMIRANELFRSYDDKVKTDTRGIIGPTIVVTKENLKISCKELKRHIQTRNLVHLEIPKRNIYYGDDDKWVKSQYTTSKRGLKKLEMMLPKRIELLHLIEIELTIRYTN